MCAKRGSILDAIYPAKWVNFQCKSTVTGLTVYFRDSYDFIGDQYLGCFSFLPPFVTYYNPSTDWTCFSNATFQTYSSTRANLRTTPGKDFRIFSTADSSQQVPMNGKVFKIPYKLNPEEVQLRKSLRTSNVVTKQIDPTSIITNFYNKYKDYFGTKSGAAFVSDGFTYQPFNTGKYIAVRNSDGMYWYFDGKTWYGPFS